MFTPLQDCNPVTQIDSLLQIMLHLSSRKNEDLYFQSLGTSQEHYIKS